MLVLGWLALGVGILGIFLPLLPTTPFVLLAAFLFSRGSKRCHDWLLSHRTFGPLIQDWERGGVIRLTAKVWSTAMIVPLFSYTLLFVQVATWVKGVVVLVGAAVLTFIWTRPSGLVRSHDKAA
ncbi:hypothetical protein E3A20_27470 [Planctomyces bekefii]|uniref:Inner membrane protein YbaN n=1 Tax=Planctomyces bekefii TaxID=1653850 RepID=A0A5C6M4G0_9PLAN|nr:hypothetical protein E3A20_27470 [Planctomyces bekefii]